jgi:hypothetical protein
MRPVIPAAQAIRARRRHIIEVPMVWIAARNRDTGNVEGIGFWKGQDVEQIVVGDMFTGVGVARTFYHQGLQDVSAIRHEAGMNIHPVTITLSAIDTAVNTALRLYDPRGAEVQIWRRCYDPDTRQPLGVEGRYAGWVDEIEYQRPEPGGEAVVTLTTVSLARMLTIASPRKKSHTAQHKRVGTACPSGDMIRQYKDNAGQWDVPWGAVDRA